MLYGLVKSWDTMAKEYEVDRGSIYGPSNVFVDTMIHSCLTFIPIDLTKEEYNLIDENGELPTNEGYTFHPWMISSVVEATSIQELQDKYPEYFI